MLGIVTAGGQMNLSLVCLQSDLDTGTMTKIKDCAIDCLEKAIKE